MRPRTIMNPSVLRRLSAAAALVALVLALAVTCAVLLRSVVVLPLVVLGVVVTVLAGWTSLVSRGRRRLVTAVVGLVALAGTLVVLGVETVAGTALVLGLVVASNAAARYALASEPGFVAPARTGHHVGPSEHGVLLLNPRSGGGKVTRFDLVAEAERRGITAVLLEAGDDLRALAERAAAGGASAIGMAGGDGSQAIVADVARTHDIAFVCVPAGTRNHFAADLGLDRDNVATALDAYGAAVERRVDLASVGGRIFVNNASLGAYAAIVQSEAYRDAKMSTAAALLPNLVGPSAPAFDLRYDGPDGRAQHSADVLMVSNNPYALRTLSGVGARPRLDAGVLGIVVVRAKRGHDGTTRAAARGGVLVRHFPGMHEWVAETFRVDSAQPVMVGVDGEAMQMEPPLEFRSHPAVLRVRLPLTCPGAQRSLMRTPGVKRVAVALLRVMANRPASPEWDRVVDPATER